MLEKASMAVLVMKSLIRRQIDMVLFYSNSFAIAIAIWSKPGRPVAAPVKIEWPARSRPFSSGIAALTERRACPS
jgi:hypothetical protein